ncbi:hypothetical protein FE697_000830 [Mumia zhuanghuii]|uniref:Ig-like domain-containing protein n=2 Tax=Mumia TaxID=1546255 RepID=A0ABW1QQK5_9ACTN|nr:MULTISPECIES: hypothetical protein [Mumia]KAA1424508.1 hypothetical protein FE697_000830 [Mumia zhuanghuii]
MRRSSSLALAVGAALVASLSGCSLATENPAAADPSASASASATPTAVPPAAPDLLSFQCLPSSDPRRWTASGVILNRASTADYRVTILVASPGATRAKARRLVIPKVATGVETPFTVEGLTVNQGSAPACRVQLVRMD